MTDIDKLRKEYRNETGSTWNMTYEWYLQWLEKELLKARTKLKNNGDLGDVGESHASGKDCKSDLASGELPLEKITDDGKSFYCYWQEKHGHDRCTTKCAMCTRKDKRLKSS